MDSKILCHDDFLSTSDFLMLQNCILGTPNENRFPWTWGMPSSPDDIEKSDINPLDNYQLFHLQGDARPYCPYHQYTCLAFF